MNESILYPFLHTVGEAVLGLRTLAIGSDFLQISWRSTVARPVDQYDIFWIAVPTGHAQYTRTNYTNITLTGLHTDTQYRFRVCFNIFVLFL